VVVSDEETTPYFAATVAADAGDEVVVALEGELDVATAAQLDEMLGPLWQRGGRTRVIFDLSGLRFLDASGIAVLIRAVNRFGAVQLRSPSQIVRDVIDATKLGDVLRLEG
jgi:anti-anti-sigma factor